jgi:predicted DNA-binding transcriptional regulator AlpA
MAFVWGVFLTKRVIDRQRTVVKPHYVAATEAAALISMSESWFWDAVRRGKMPKGIKLGAKATRWEVSAVLAAVLEFDQEPASA